MSRLLMTLAVATCLNGCGSAPPTGPCLGAEPQTVTISRPVLEQVSHEVEDELELARFVFAPPAGDGGPGGTVQVSAGLVPAGPAIDARTGEAIRVQGDQVVRVTMHGLVGGADTDRLRADPANPYAIREIVQVRTDVGAAWQIGIVGGLCARLRASEGSDVVVVSVTPD